MAGGENGKKRRHTKKNKGNSFYDVMKPRAYKDKMEYKLVAGLTMAIFTKTGGK